MSPFECPFEEDVITLAVQGRRPDAALQAHADVCPVCGDLLRLAPEFDVEAARLRADARVPDAGRVWWMAQLRARHEAARDAGRPITAAQIIAFTCSIALLGACLGATSTWFQATLARLAGFASSIPLRGVLSYAAALLSEHAVIIALSLAALIAVPAAFLAVSRE